MERWRIVLPKFFSDAVLNASNGHKTKQMSMLFGQPFIKRFALCYRSIVCPVYLSVTLMYCGQMVGWIKMKLGVKIGLDPGHTVLDGEPSPPPQRGTAPQFSAHVCCGQMAGLIKMPLGTKVGVGTGDIVLDGD